jgi:DNA-binding LytR/AlgR family response regulator
MKVLIIEDESIAAKDLEACIKSIRADYEIVFIANSVKEAVHFLKQPLVVRNYFKIDPFLSLSVIFLSYSLSLRSLSFFTSLSIV